MQGAAGLTHLGAFGGQARAKLGQTQPRRVAVARLGLSCGSKAAHSGVGLAMPDFNFHQQN